MIHPESESRGDAFQVIPDIPHFYCYFNPFWPRLEIFVLRDEVDLHSSLYPILRRLTTIQMKRLKAAKSSLIAAAKEEAEKIDPETFSLALQLHSKHPVIAILGSRVAIADHDPGFRHYVRINSDPEFIHVVTPELEKRLAKSAILKVTGGLHLGFHRGLLATRAKVSRSSWRKASMDINDWATLRYEKSA
ncbi:hypothetical protein BX616_001401 [Lobosporangium transversale]|uniref:Uncharacterized protein n=1 Tax=Lobosporangium transversale TaxID=64571 RepID=A0A1Y2GKA7_9FUNG|nr:hypothetical protein BCR41DRAFT_397248 [Lobosporangium transversale]KAF9904117.1 hypothetical protein BX616_001401 [Lobosporangium transversale]ORZ13416.1 hypothetical protein BCR41DRAFT_397248 [Lobosporangium transversale]|eukprot:XP_021880497.1 hypothetical protein BCR41DRAFT_397248 [Lobosporangium transversale]